MKYIKYIIFILFTWSIANAELDSVVGVDMIVGGAPTLVYHFDCNANTDDQAPTVGTGNIRTSGVTDSATECSGDGITSDGTTELIYIGSPSFSTAKGSIEIRFEATSGDVAYSRIIFGSIELLKNGSDTSLAWKQSGISDWNFSTTINIWDGNCHTLKIQWDSDANERFFWVDDESHTDTTAFSAFSWTGNQYFMNNSSPDRPAGGTFEDIKCYNDY